MKKQYRVSNKKIGFKEYIYLYHDGVLVNKYSIWEDDLDDEMDRLKKDGYEFGYTKEEVDCARMYYEDKLNNIIAESKGE